MAAMTLYNHTRIFSRNHTPTMAITYPHLKGLFSAITPDGLAISGWPRPRFMALEALFPGLREACQKADIWWRSPVDNLKVVCLTHSCSSVHPADFKIALWPLLRPRGREKPKRLAIHHICYARRIRDATSPARYWQQAVSQY
jgi:hypothetical protein